MSDATAADATGIRAESRRARVPGVFAVALVATILPVWVAAWRVASSGFPPMGDAALTVTRAHDVFTAHPPLVGMPAASGAFGDTVTSFPGPLQLYALAGPVKLFGNVWGTPIAMGALSTLWIVLAAWMLWRCHGRGTATAGVALLGVFAWSIGIGYLVDPVPATMLIFPLVPFLLVAWCATTGDPPALVAAAVIGNFLWLDHLILVVVVPVVLAVAVIGHLLAVKRPARAATATADEPRHRWRGVVVAAIVSVAMWTPTLIAEATRRPGNLELLVQSSGHERAVVGSWSFSVHVLIGLIATPPFWLRGSFDQPPFHNVPGAPTVAGASTAFDVVVGLVLAVVFLALLVATHRRGERTAFWGLTVAIAALVAAVPTIYSTPTRFGIAGYVRPLWGVAAFVWFVVGYSLWRLTHQRLSRFGERAVWALAALAVVVGLGNLPTGTRGYVPDDVATASVDRLHQAVADHLSDGRPLALRTRPDYVTQGYFGALVLALRSAGTDFCVQAGSPPLAGVAECGDRRRRVVGLAVSDDASPETFRSASTIAAIALWSSQDQRQFADLDARVGSLLERDRPVALSRAGRRILTARGPGAVRAAEDALAELTEPAPLAERKKSLRTLVALWLSDPASAETPPFADAGLSVAEWRRWADLADRRAVLVLEDLGESGR